MKKYKLYPFKNGGSYGWGKIRSLFDFFFPYSKNGSLEYIRAEASETFGQDKIRNCYTFRAFAWDIVYEFLINPLRLITGIQRMRVAEALRMLKTAQAMGIPMRHAFSIGAIAFDTAATIIDAGDTPQSASFTCTGTNRYLVVGGLADTPSATITSITYNSVGMTAIASKRKTAGNAYLIGLYGLGNPASGSNTVTQTNSAGLVRTAASSYSGAQQTSAADSSNTGENTSATGLTVSTTVVAANCWVIGLFFNNQAETKSAGANTTLRIAFVQASPDFSATQGAICDSAAVVSPGANSLIVNGSGAAADWVGIVMSIAPAAAAGGTATFSNLMTMGV